MGDLLVVHVITGLKLGGAERALVNLVTAPEWQGVAHEVVSLTDEGAFGAALRRQGIPLTALGMRKRPWDAVAFTRLVRHLRLREPEIVHTWMYHADFLGGLAARLAGRKRILWALQHTELPLRSSPLTTWLVMRLSAALSRRLPAAIVSCSHAGARWHAARGYAADKMRVITNGTDPDRFKPNPLARERLRRRLGLSQDALLIGMAARLHPQKDHRTFLEAARRLARQDGRVHFVLFGEGMEPDNPRLKRWMEDPDLAGRVHCLGALGRPEDVLAGLDILALSSSHGEGAPLAVLEGMACGLPCVVTDVGDAARLVGEAGLVVPPRDPQALAQAWSTLLSRPAAERQRMGRAARQRVMADFQVSHMVLAYRSLYIAMLASPARAARR